MFKQTWTILECSEGPQRQRGDKKIREKAKKKKKKSSGGSINNRTQRGVDENQTKRVTCALRPHTACLHTCFGPYERRHGGNRAPKPELEVTKAPKTWDDNTCRVSFQIPIKLLSYVHFFPPLIWQHLNWSASCLNDKPIRFNSASLNCMQSH